jgi:quercetin dioxygenase-like cupin family protein
MKKSIIVLAIFALVSCKSVQPTAPVKTMNLKDLHTELSDVQTALLFTPSDNKVVSLQIAKGKQLAEHITQVPALLVCVSGSGSYGDQNGKKLSLKPGDYVKIEPNIKHWVDAFEDSNFLLIK